MGWEFPILSYLFLSSCITSLLSSIFHLYNPFQLSGTLTTFLFILEMISLQVWITFVFLLLSLDLNCLEQTLPLVLYFVVCNTVYSKWVRFQLSNKENSWGIKEIIIENNFLNLKFHLLLFLTAALSNFSVIKLTKFSKNLS